MQKPIVAIVGRPNVGKSTLFNRLIGERKAIVFPEPGVTRDRHYGEVDWAGHEFILIDTGGYVPRSEDVFELAIREQVALSIEEAQVVLFLVDAKEGIFPLDEEIATMLRRYAKPVVLIANKVDSDKTEPSVAQFYALGLGEPQSISAITGRRTGDLLDIVVKDFPSEITDDEDTRMHLAIIGRPNVGKSSITNALLGKNRSIVTAIPGTTRDSVDSVLKYHGQEIVLIDTAGLRRRSKVFENIEFFSTVRTLKSIQRCDVALCLFDAADGVTNQDIWVLNEATRFNKGVVIGLNKWDIVEKDDTTVKKYEEVIHEKIPMHKYIPIVTVSAVTKQRVAKVLETCLQVHEERSKRVETSDLNAALFDLLRATPPPATPTGKAVKFYYATQVREAPPVIILFVNEPKYIPESYRRFVEKNIREFFGFSGVPVTVQFRRSK